MVGHWLMTFDGVLCPRCAPRLCVSSCGPWFATLDLCHFGQGHLRHQDQDGRSRDGPAEDLDLLLFLARGVGKDGEEGVAVMLGEAVSG